MDGSILRRIVKDDEAVGYCISNLSSPFYGLGQVKKVGFGLFTFRAIAKANSTDCESAPKLAPRANAYNCLK